MKITGKIKMALMFAIAIMFVNNATAQETNEAKNYDQGFRLGFGLNAGYATEDPYKLTLGADARLQYDLNKRYSITLTTGFTNLFVSENGWRRFRIYPCKSRFKSFCME